MSIHRALADRMYAALRALRRATPAALVAGGCALALSRKRSAEQQATPLKLSSPAAPVDAAPASDETDVHPVGLHLIHAQVLFRHGHRTPVHVHHAMPHGEGWHAAADLPSEAASVVMVNALVRAPPAWAVGRETRPAQPVPSGTHQFPSRC